MIGAVRKWLEGYDERDSSKVCAALTVQGRAEFAEGPDTCESDIASTFEGMADDGFYPAAIRQLDAADVKFSDQSRATLSMSVDYGTEPENFVIRVTRDGNGWKVPNQSDTSGQQAEDSSDREKGTNSAGVAENDAERKVLEAWRASERLYAARDQPEWCASISTQYRTAIEEEGQGSCNERTLPKGSPTGAIDSGTIDEINVRGEIATIVYRRPEDTSQVFVFLVMEDGAWKIGINNCPDGREAC